MAEAEAISNGPRVEDLHPSVLKVLGVPGGQGGAVCSADGGDLRVIAADGCPQTIPAVDDLGVAERCSRVEREDLICEAAEHFKCSSPYPRLAFAPRETLDAVEDLGHGYGRHLQFATVTPFYPALHPGRRVGLHELGNDICVDDDHRAKSAGRGASVREGRSRSTPPSARALATRAASGPSSSPGSRTASTRIARISASIDRPCAAARSLRRSRTRSSRFRILTSATVTHLR